MGISAEQCTSVRSTGFKNAGLNPILSASNSQIASMPQVSDNGVTSATSNIASSVLQAASAKELKLMDLKIEEQKLRMMLSLLRLKLIMLVLMLFLPVFMVMTLPRLVSVMELKRLILKLILL